MSFIDNSVDTTTGTIQFKGLFPNQEERLWPGEFVNVTLTLEAAARHGRGAVASGANGAERKLRLYRVSPT